MSHIRCDSHVSHLAGLTLDTSKPHIVITPVSPLTPACPFRRQFRSVGNELILEHRLHKRNARRFPRTLLTLMECSPIFRLVFSVQLLVSSVATSISVSHARLKWRHQSRTYIRSYLLQTVCCPFGFSVVCGPTMLSALTCSIVQCST